MTEQPPAPKPQTPAQRLAQEIRDHGNSSEALRRDTAERIKGGKRKKP